MTKTKTYFLFFSIVLLFVGNNSVNAQLKPVGDIVFTDNQKTKLTQAFANPSANFPDNNINFYNDIDDINKRAEEFRTDMSTMGEDRGAYDFLHKGLEATIPNCPNPPVKCLVEPFPQYWDENNKPLLSHRNIHSAAIKAYAANDLQLAEYVFEAIKQRAQDDNLDFSNGGKKREELGEPARPNGSYGQIERFPYEGYPGYETPSVKNPWFMLASKMEQYAISYSLIYDMIGLVKIGEILKKIGLDQTGFIDLTRLTIKMEQCCTVLQKRLHRQSIIVQVMFWHS